MANILGVVRTSLRMSDVGILTAIGEKEIWIDHDRFLPSG